VVTRWSDFGVDIWMIVGRRCGLEWGLNELTSEMYKCEVVLICERVYVSVLMVDDGHNCLISWLVGCGWAMGTAYPCHKGGHLRGAFGILTSYAAYAWGGNVGESFRTGSW